MRLIQSGCLTDIKGNITSEVVEGIADPNEFSATEENVNKFWSRRKKEF